MTPLTGQINAVFFDMDGTLVDSEPYTERSVDALLRACGVHRHGLDPASFHGLTWASIAAMIAAAHPRVASACTPEALHHHFHALWLTEPPDFIPGALDALTSASQHMRTAIVTSSLRESVEALIARADLRPLLSTYVCAEETERSKPDPDGYLKAAARVGAAPDTCLVFEDSIAGLQAAAAAGMWSIAITHGSADPARAASLATRAISDYTRLEAGFFEAIARGIPDPQL